MAGASKLTLLTRVPAVAEEAATEAEAAVTVKVVEVEAMVEAEATVEVEVTEAGDSKVRLASESIRSFIKRLHRRLRWRWILDIHKVLFMYIFTLYPF